MNRKIKILFAGSAGTISGFTTGAGNSWMEGNGFGKGLWDGTKAGLIGGTSSALIGGFMGGLQHRRQMLQFSKGNTILGLNAGDPVPATDKFLLDAQQAWYPDAPMNNVNVFTVENVHLEYQSMMTANNARAGTRPLSVDKILTGNSNVYFNKDLAFTSAEQLFYTMGHEFIHVSQYAALAGLPASIRTTDFISMLEYHAYSYEHSLGGVQLNSFTRDELIRWSSQYPQFNNMGYMNFHWYKTAKFIYPF